MGSKELKGDKMRTSQANVWANVKKANQLMKMIGTNSLLL